MSKVTSKRQVTIPKEVADRYAIGPGDEIRWVPAGDEIRVVPPGASAITRLGPSERLALFDRATERRERRTTGREEKPGEVAAAERGWTRDELYARGRTR
ncbi:MAG: AbrB/MazE/SpoVT family DNA-binding domain-containing protein [Longimicrobiales bacterium]|nr:AbrB/MazE/SpoVT family DNA-binding domain-containing protein [Longimicrobiales bacterium]